MQNEHSTPRENTQRETATENTFDFRATLREHALDLTPVTIDTLQVNITRLCNQACLHCHVDASPKRTEHMDPRTMERCLEILAAHDEIRTLDITGGAPELHPQFDDLVKQARERGRHVMVRHNLTVTMDGNPQTGKDMSYLPEFFAEHDLEVVSSLPYYQQFFTDRQRGRGVFEKSIESLKLLNAAGYGTNGLALDLVYNPAGAFLPAPQERLEEDFKKALDEKFGVAFTRLFTITNMPIRRFLEQLRRNGTYEEYMEKLVGAFNPAAAEGVMCRTMLSVGYDGTIFDCDFNQMLDLPIAPERHRSVFDFDFDRLVRRDIVFDSHCFGCTAGGGSSCGGALE